ncbi:carboxymuconolactone decarboxylase [Mycobacterium malmoense]|nr:carboxymuconolactone decarboxylase [Mycobacterium malmoense]
MVTEIVTPRIAVLEPPYEGAVAAQLQKMMPPNVPPIALFRTVVRNMPMAEAMTLWGGYELSRSLSLSLRDREIVIDRTCARCGCEYEWGVHVAFFAEKARLDREQVRSLTHGGADDSCWTAERDRLLVRAVDALCDRRDIDDALWTALRGEFDEREMLDLTMLCGWYHAISFTARAARVPLEPGSPTFAGIGR